MTPFERDKRPEHHIVHDYANLVSSAKIRFSREFKGVKLSDLAPLKTHVWHAFYMNCRKMYEFFCYKQKRGGLYLRAVDFVPEKVSFGQCFLHWTDAVQEHMSIHLLHVGSSRVIRNVTWTGEDDHLYLADFEQAWRHMLANLKAHNRPIFREEIELRLNSEFEHCGDLSLPLLQEN
jgi:hypothetical protein